LYPSIQIWIQWKLWWKWRVFDASDWKQERTSYLSLLGHIVSRKTSSLISLIDLATRNSQLAAHSSSLAVFTVRSPWYDSRALRFFKGILSCVTYLILRRFTSLHENNRNTCICRIFLSNPDQLHHPVSPWADQRFFLPWLQLPFSQRDASTRTHTRIQTTLKSIYRLLMRIDISNVSNVLFLLSYINNLSIIYEQSINNLWIIHQ